MFGVNWRTIARWRIAGKTAVDGSTVHLVGCSTGRWRYAGADVRSFLAAIQPAGVPIAQHKPHERHRSAVDDRLDAAGL